ncbi:Golgin subfamily A member 5 [Araneus ventricosus]|uniref:Golgin subfamily A member 5 n=1 Tax=Araneus ventricosus TaxID=182803 RepID=A0A4Y2T9H3_ARAVE|nr:Golgin subfamily A member 5 [Araneus ventricosus]
MEWRSVVFSDESRFCLGASVFHVLVRRSRGKHLQPTCLRPRHTGLAPRVMFWGAISYHSRSTLVVIPRTLTANLYVSLVIQPVVLPFMNSIQGGVFQQDNTHPHTTVVTQHALQSVDMLPWPARSPDLSPIEHVWDFIGRQLQHHPQPALTVPVLTDQMQQAWNFGIFFSVSVCIYVRFWLEGNELTAKSLSSVSQDELESRLHALTENLIQKQTLVEALSTEKNSLLLQRERLEQQLNEALNYGMQQHAYVGINNNESERKSKAVFLENPFDSALTRRVKRVYGSIDSFSIRLGVFFRRYPITRVFVIIYMLLLHFWVMIVLLTYEPEVHNANYEVSKNQ